MLPGDVFGAPGGAKSLSCNSNRRFAILFPGRSAQTKGKKIYSRRRLFEKNQRVTAFKAYIEEKPRRVADECVERMEAARLSRRREAHHQRTERLFCNSGVSTGVGSEYGQGINAPHESDHNLALRPHGNRAHERSCAKSRGKFWRQVWRQFWRQFPAQKYP